MNKAFALALVLVFLAAFFLTAFKQAWADSQVPQLQWSLSYPRQPSTMNNAKVYHFDVGSCFVQTSDGGYLIAGNLEDDVYWGPHGGFFDNYSATIIKTDSFGNLQWQKINPAFSNTVAIFQTKDLGYLAIVGGWYLLKLDAQGNIQSNSTLGISISGAIQTADGDYVLAGTNDKIGMLVKTDENGNLLWNTTLFSLDPHSNDIWASNLAMTKDGGYEVACWGEGYGEVIGTDADLALFKTDSNGNLQFSKSYNYNPAAGQTLPPEVSSGNPTFPTEVYIAATNDGGCLLAGTADSPDFTAPFLVKIDSQGNWEWNRTYVTSDMLGGSIASVVQGTDGGYFAVGSIGSNDASKGALLFKTDALGNMQWNQTYGQASATLVSLANDGGYTVTGSGSGNIWLAEFALPKANVSSNTPFPTAITPFSPAMIAVIVVAVVVSVTSLLVYLKKYRHQNSLPTPPLPETATFI
jgi:hypothetical protein